MEKSQHPSHAELYSLEMRVRRERSREIGRLLLSGAAAVAAALQRVFSHEPKGVRHA